MRSFRHEFQVNASIASVAEFHSSSYALKQLTPPPIIVKFNKVELLGEGSRSDFTMWFGPIPIHWVAVHSEVNPEEGFIDTQVEGPFQTWIHRHTFQSVSHDKTRIIDQVEGQPSKHIFWGLVSRFMWLTLPVLFSYRARQTRKAVEQQ
jgi:ligand-binding SRPBCC domain-containing protein